MEFLSFSFPVDSPRVQQDRERGEKSINFKLNFSFLLMKNKNGIIMQMSSYSMQFIYERLFASDKGEFV